jgi:hypothetical protein
MLRAAVLLIVVTLLPAPQRCRAQDQPRRTENVIVITLDGFRWHELFTGADESLLDAKFGGVRDLNDLKRRFWRPSAVERREALLPFFWGNIAREGQVFGDPSKKSPAHSTNGLKFSYPGYSEMFCGFADERIDSNSKRDNPNLSVLEFLHGKAAYKDRVAAFCTWDVFPFIFRSSKNGLKVHGRQAVDRPAARRQRDDGAPAALLAGQHLRRDHHGGGARAPRPAQAACPVHRSGRDGRVGPWAAL